MDKPKLKLTDDGSHTLIVESLDETYHSTHGAIQEAVHVYIDAGFNCFEKLALNILEVGFGTGLNTLLTYMEAIKKEVNVNYIAIEAYPLEPGIVTELNYLEELDADESVEQIFSRLHSCAWEQKQEISKSFSLHKINLKLEEFSELNDYDVIYFDAFGPRVQPELWEVEILRRMFDALKIGGVMVTYCAKGSVKRALKEVGFTIENIPGPPGKREMTRAYKL